MNRLPLILLLLLILGFCSCKRELSGARYDSTDELQIMDYIEGREDLSIFKELIDYTKQRNLLKTAGSYTLFVPNNEAFEKLFQTLAQEGETINSIYDKEPEYWLSYLRYHLLMQKVNSNELEFGPLPAPTMFNNKYLIADISESYVSIRLNSAAKIIESNIELANGYVNVLDYVLMPPTKNIYETLQSSGRYNIMLSIFEEMGYLSYLKDSTITLLVETDEALLKSGFSKDAIENLEEWTQYHIIADSGYFLNNMAGKRYYSLYTKEATSFDVNLYGQYFANKNFPFSSNTALGINRVCNNGILHTLDTMLQIVEAPLATIRFNLYPPGSPYGAQNVFTNAPATITLNTGTQSYHQNKENKIVAFNAIQVGDYFWMTIPDVPAGKYRIRMIHRSGGTRGKYIVIYNNEIVHEGVNMAAQDGTFEEWSYLVYNNCGEINVDERSDVTLYFAFADFGSNKNPSYCCDLLMDIVELIPITD